MKLPLLPCLILVPVVAQGQQRCVNPLAGAHWRQTPLVAHVSTPAAGDRDRDRYVATLLQGMASMYADPATPTVSAGGGMVVMGAIWPEAERPPRHAELEVGVDRRGHAVAARLLSSSGLAALDTALLDAVRAGGSGDGYGKMPRKLRGDTVNFTIVVDDRGAPANAVPLGVLSSPYLIAQRPPVIRSMPPARAPRGHGGKQVVLGGTVGADGHLIPATIRVVSSSDSLLIPIARASFEKALFRPGTHHGCPAEATIRQVFRFP